MSTTSIFQSVRHEIVSRYGQVPMLEEPCDERLLRETSVDSPAGRVAYLMLNDAENRGLRFESINWSLMLYILRCPFA